MFEQSDTSIDVTRVAKDCSTFIIIKTNQIERNGIPVFTWLPAKSQLADDILLLIRPSMKCANHTFTNHLIIFLQMICPLSFTATSSEQEKESRKVVNYFIFTSF